MPPQRRRSDPVIIEVGRGPATGPPLAPGSLYLDTDWLEIERDHWKIVADHLLIAVLEQCGIEPTSLVRLHGRSPLAVARVAWAMRYAGVREVQVFQDGTAAAPGASLHPHSAPWGASPWWRALRPELLMTRDRLRALLEDPQTVIADVRSRSEFDGLTSGDDDVKARGRIPGAVFLHGGPDAHRLDHYIDEQGAFHPLEQVRRLWLEAGVDGSQHVVFYSGTGWRAAVAFLYAQALGFPRISLYDGGWHEWGSSDG